MRRKEREHYIQDMSLPILTHNGIVGLGVFVHVSEILSQRHSIIYHRQDKGHLFIQVVWWVGAGLGLVALEMNG